MSNKTRIGRITKIIDGFGFINTKDGDVFFLISSADDLKEDLAEGKIVEVNVCQAWNERKGCMQDQVTEFHSVRDLIVATNVLCEVKVFFRDKPFGFVTVIDDNSCISGDAFISNDICKQAGVLIGKGMAMRAKVREVFKDGVIKLEVVSFKHTPKIQAELIAAQEGNVAWTSDAASVSADAPSEVAESKDAAPAKAAKKAEAATKTAAKPKAKKPVVLRTRRKVEMHTAAPADASNTSQLAEQLQVQGLSGTN